MTNHTAKTSPLDYVRSLITPAKICLSIGQTRRGASDLAYGNGAFKLKIYL